VTIKALSSNIINSLFSVFCLGGGFVVAAVAADSVIRAAVTVAAHTTRVTVIDWKGVSTHADIRPVFCVVTLRALTTPVT
jgi:hypothetical protein